MSIRDDDSDFSPETEAGSGFNTLQLLSRRWPLLVVGLVIGTFIGIAIHIRSLPQYQSSAQLLVVKKRTEFVKEGDVRVGAVEDYVATQVTLIKSEKIRLSAGMIAKEMPLSPGLIRDERVLAGMINLGLTISRDTTSSTSTVGSGVLDLTFRSGNPEDSKLLLSAVIQAHQAELYSIYDQATQEETDLTG